MVVLLAGFLVAGRISFGLHVYELVCLIALLVDTLFVWLVHP